MADKESHFRASAQRRAILEYLRGTERHLTAEQVFGGIKRQWKSIGLGTVYRNLKFLHEHGYIEEVVSADHIARYSRRVDAHAHFRCLRCGEIYEYDLPENFQDERERIEKEGHYVRASVFEYTGICTTCQTRSTPTPLPEIFCQAYMKYTSEFPIDISKCGPCTYREQCQFAPSR